MRARGWWPSTTRRRVSGGNGARGRWSDPWRRSPKNATPPGRRKAHQGARGGPGRSGLRSGIDQSVRPGELVARDLRPGRVADPKGVADPVRLPRVGGHLQPGRDALEQVLAIAVRMNGVAGEHDPAGAVHDLGERDDPAGAGAAAGVRVVREREAGPVARPWRLDEEPVGDPFAALDGDPAALRRLTAERVALDGDALDVELLVGDRHVPHGVEAVRVRLEVDGGDVGARPHVLVSTHRDVAGGDEGDRAAVGVLEPVVLDDHVHAGVGRGLTADEDEIAVRALEPVVLDGDVGRALDLEEVRPLSVRPDLVPLSIEVEAGEDRPRAGVVIELE